MAVYSADAVQTVNPGESVIFSTKISSCPRRMIRHRNGTGSFLLSGASPCRCKDPEYVVDFGANIAVATGGTAEAISLAISLDGSTVPASEMIVTPAAVEEYFNVSREIAINVWQGCCESISVINTSDQPIFVQNALIDIVRK